MCKFNVIINIFPLPSTQHFNIESWSSSFLWFFHCVLNRLTHPYRHSLYIDSARNKQACKQINEWARGQNNGEKEEKYIKYEINFNSTMGYKKLYTILQRWAFNFQQCCRQFPINVNYIFYILLATIPRKVMGRNFYNFIKSTGFSIKFLRNFNFADKVLKILKNLT